MKNTYQYSNIIVASTVDLVFQFIYRFAHHVGYIVLFLVPSVLEIKANLYSVNTKLGLTPNYIFIVFE